jgi:hypothetical protein
MKTVAEYIEHAREFERLAAMETNAQTKAELESQAAAYRGLAADRAKEIGSEPSKE